MVAMLSMTACLAVMLITAAADPILLNPDKYSQHFIEGNIY